ncbi:Stress response NST1-like protein [Quillaja saponaria]|uniref:Stress response NST1-like protein n=1 Tax=Quillaja saponaria TaxID=32244 RepID=A0AAD7LRA1_QUISA|nr:Stress response NST1-like protein [Quillaja saponaria]
MFRAKAIWFQLPEQFKLVQARPFCSNNNSNKTSNTKKPIVNNEKVDSNYWETYRKLDKLDFMSAAKIVFSEPSKKKKFGIDFHLVQLFFVCMPSLAVYLVAQYARYEMRKMDMELEQKKKQEQEKEKAIMELSTAKEKEAGPDPELLEVKERLDKLEEAVKEIVVVSQKQLGSNPTKNQENGSKGKHIASTEPSNANSRSESTKPIEKHHLSAQDSLKPTPNKCRESVSGSPPASNASLQDQRSKTQDGGGANRDAKT